MYAKRLFLALASAVLVGACGTTTEDVRSGEAWDEAMWTTLNADRDAVQQQVVNFLRSHEYEIEYAESRFVIEGYHKGQPVKQNVEVMVRIEEGGDDRTRVGVVAGSSLGIHGPGEDIDEQLIDYLNETFGVAPVS